MHSILKGAATTRTNELLSCESEAFEDWSVESVVEDTCVKNVLLCGNESRNGYKIPPTAFGSEDHVKSLYDGRHVFLNHLSPEQMKKQHPASRDVRDLAGVIGNVRFVNGRPYGDIQTAGCSCGPMLVGLATSKVKGVGLSHVAEYKFTDTKRLCVESVKQVVSVDVVVRPATTNTFTEQTAGMEQELANLRAELATANTNIANSKTALQTAETRIVELNAENTQLKTRITEFEAVESSRQLDVAITAELEQAGIDRKNTDHCGTVFLETLQSISDSEKRKAIIADRAALLKLTPEQTTSKKQVSGERKTGGNDKPADPVADALNSPNLFV